MPVAIVTGAGKRIGRAIALGLAQDGFDIAVHYGRSAAEAAETVDAIAQLGRRAAAIQTDLADPAAVDGLVDAVTARLGPAEVLVNNASRFEYDRHDTWTAAGFDAHVAVNLRAPLRLSQRLIDTLPRGSTGCIVQMLDQKLFNLNPDFFTYTVAKLALKESVALLAQAAAPRCRVNGVAPGLTLRSAHQKEQQFDAVHDTMPLGRGTTPEDIAQAVRYLVSASAVTGEIVAVDCGERLRASDRDIMFRQP